jgi:hypothetical protein
MSLRRVETRLADPLDSWQHEKSYTRKGLGTRDFFADVGPVMASYESQDYLTSRACCLTVAAFSGPLINETRISKSVFFALSS